MGRMSAERLLELQGVTSPHKLRTRMTIYTYNVRTEEPVEDLMMQATPPPPLVSYT